MSIYLDEGLLPGSRMTIDQVSVDNKALTQRVVGQFYKSGTGVPPVNHAQDARATSKKFAPPGDSD